jgi:hypothetical protein
MQSDQFVLVVFGLASNYGIAQSYLKCYALGSRRAALHFGMGWSRRSARRVYGPMLRCDLILLRSHLWMQLHCHSFSDIHWLAWDKGGLVAAVLSLA